MPAGEETAMQVPHTALPVFLEIDAGTPSPSPHPPLALAPFLLPKSQLREGRRRLGVPGGLVCPSAAQRRPSGLWYRTAWLLPGVQTQGRGFRAQGSGLNARGSGLRASGRLRAQGSGLRAQASGLQGSGLQGSGLQGSGLQGSGLQGSGLQGSGLQGLRASGAGGIGKGEGEGGPEPSRRQAARGAARGGSGEGKELWGTFLSVSAEGKGREGKRGELCRKRGGVVGAASAAEARRCERSEG